MQHAPYEKYSMRLARERNKKIKNKESGKNDKKRQQGQADYKKTVTEKLKGDDVV